MSKKTTTIWFSVLACCIYQLPSLAEQQRQGYRDERDKRVYKTVRIGNREWFAENVAYLPHVSPMGRGDGIWVGRYYKNDPVKAKETDYYQRYGCLYSEKQAAQLCPPGWRLPTIADWEALIQTLGGMEQAGNRLKAPGITNWSAHSEGSEQLSGFAALPAGDILIDEVILLRGVGKNAKFWVADANGLVETIYYIADDGFVFYQDAFEDMFGCSVRYVRDVPGPDPTPATKENQD